MFYQNIFRQIFSINWMIFFRSRDTEKTTKLLEMKWTYISSILISAFVFSSYSQNIFYDITYPIFNIPDIIIFYNYVDSNICIRYASHLQSRIVAHIILCYEYQNILLGPSFPYQAPLLLTLRNRIKEYSYFDRYIVWLSYGDTFLNSYLF